MKPRPVPRHDEEALPEGGPPQLVLELGHAEARSEADFIVNDDNRLAFEHLVAWPAWPGPLTLLEGPEKSGKSHLARIWAERAGAAAATPETLESLARGADPGPVLVEDADRLAYAEPALFHLLNRAMREDRSVLITARAPVSAWPYRTEDLRSRARLAARFSLEAPDDILLSQMLVKLFADRQVAVEPRIVSYLVARMERSGREVVALVALMDRLALSRGKPVTRAIAAEALALRTGHSANPEEP